MPNYYDASIGAAFEAIAAKKFSRPSWSIETGAQEALTKSVCLAVEGVGAPSHVARQWCAKETVMLSALTIASHLEEDGVSRPNQNAYTVTAMVRLFIEQFEVMKRRRSSAPRKPSPDEC